MQTSFPPLFSFFPPLFSFPSAAASRKPQLKAIVSGKSELASNKERAVTTHDQNNGILS